MTVKTLKKQLLVMYVQQKINIEVLIVHCYAVLP